MWAPPAEQSTSIFVHMFGYETLEPCVKMCVCICKLQKAGSHRFLLNWMIHRGAPCPLGSLWPSSSFRRHRSSFIIWVWFQSFSSGCCRDVKPDVHMCVCECSVCSCRRDWHSGCSWAATHYNVLYLFASSLASWTDSWGGGGAVNGMISCWSGCPAPYSLIRFLFICRICCFKGSVFASFSKRAIYLKWWRVSQRTNEISQDTYELEWFNVFVLDVTTFFHSASKFSYHSVPQFL